jgi:hypothetical protein
LAARAASMAFFTSAALAFEYLATTSACEEGLFCVRMEELLICLVSEGLHVLHACGKAYIFSSNSKRHLYWPLLLHPRNRILKLLAVYRAFGVMLL